MSKSRGPYRRGRATLVHDLLRLHADDGRVWELRPGCTLHIGTHPASDLVVELDDAAELEAKLAWASAQRAPLLSARRGWRRVRLDDRPVLGAIPLRHGQVLSIEGVGDLRVAMVRSAALELPEAQPIDLLCPPPAQDDGLFATRVWLKNVLLGLEAAGRTGVLRLVVDGQAAAITFDGGRVVDAACGDLVGLSALEQVRTGASGAWRFEARTVVRPGPLDLSIREFLRLGYWELARRRAARRSDAGTSPA
ncbi:MAG: DUF4388 domain-containing protein [Planctomycetes bacterium]|nr:DUF4388 domain-containing protein [Planctomycetota bacterium]